MKIYRVKLPNGGFTKFENKEDAVKFAKSNSFKLKKVISIDYSENGEEWSLLAVVYPNGKVLVGTGGFGFFKN